MRESTHRIKEIAQGSPAESAGLLVGDVLLSINGHTLSDIFDYHYYSDDAELVLEIRRGDGDDSTIDSRTTTAAPHNSVDITSASAAPDSHTPTSALQPITLTIRIEKNEGEDLGLVFENGLLDDYRSCSNGCVFCFIDQNPPGMRDTIYFKDDDTRLSFLQGNYVTLTNMSDEALDRIISYRLAPINVSVHATDPDIRCRMLRNRFAGDIMRKMRRIADAELPMNGQIVLCKGINDGEALERTMRDLYSLHPSMGSVSVVPVGLTKYRDGLYPLEPFDKASSTEVISQIEAFQEKCRADCGSGFVYASDEWYMKAELPLPDGVAYDGYPQIENGVGMLRSFWDEFDAALASRRRPIFAKPRKCSIISGVMPSPAVDEMCAAFAARYRGYELIHHTIINNFYGESITVTGLITGGDLIAQLHGKELGAALFLPANMFRAGEEVLLDDVTRAEVETALGVPVRILPVDGGALVDAALGHTR